MPIRRRLTPERAATLRAVPLFAGCRDADLARIDRLVVEVDVPAGEVVTSEHVRSGDSYVIASGEASVVHRERSVARLRAGDTFGALGSLVLKHPATATVTAITPLCVLVVHRNDLAGFLGVPGVAQRLLIGAVDRLWSHEGSPCL